MLFVFCFSVFFFKQNTAYEMRISDWSSDVCSSDLAVALQRRRVDDLGARQPILEIADRGFDMTLPLLGGVIFGIFRKVAVRARFLDRIDDQGPFGFEGRELRAQLLIAFRQHRSEERRGGKEGVRKCRYRWAPYH